MHITSLPGPYGVGTMGAEAYHFVEFLHRAGQSCWQILPLSPTGFGDSPYQSCSAFAGNPYLIDFDLLIEKGLLERQQVTQAVWGDKADRVDFYALYQNKLKVLHLAFQNFQETAAFRQFCLESSSWLSEYALFMALKEEQEGKPWYLWPEGEKFRDIKTLQQARIRLQEKIRFHSFVQYVFYTQWEDLKAYANQKGISIIGDVPIYVPYDSCEVWSEPELFQLEETLTPIAVAGCPPDVFTADGQLWGNPLYRWDVHKKENYRWWLRRLAQAGKLYDVVRLDHFRAFESYWAVPYGDETARGGAWEKGPGMDFFRALQKKLPGLQLIAEDLGFLTQEVFDLRDETGYPGMRVLQFAFGSREHSLYLPHTYIENTVCYIGTHDNMTLRQYLETAPAETLAYAREYMGLTDEEGMMQGVIRTALGSVSQLCVMQMQDWLGLGGEARMNFPGTIGNNWNWRAMPGSFTEKLEKEICRLTKLYGRYQQDKQKGSNYEV